MRDSRRTANKRVQATLYSAPDPRRVNVGCLEGISEGELSKVPITYVDGMNDRWQDRLEFFAHL
jgi:hypothetical protein